MYIHVSDEVCKKLLTIHIKQRNKIIGLDSVEYRLNLQMVI